MDDESSIIYGFEHQTRALSSQLAEPDIKRFLIGTQSLKSTNEVHLVEYDDETNSLTKCVYDHNYGEIWHLLASPLNKCQFLTCYNKQNSHSSVSAKCSIWSFPENVEMSLAGDESTHFPLTLVTDIPVESTITAIWEPSGGNGNNIISLSENCIYHFDCNTSNARLIQSGNLEAKGAPKFTNGKWNPHNNYSQIATCNDTAIRGWDLKSMKTMYVIENAHAQLVRDVDFNPIKQYVLASCGDDCKTKFWDIRKTSECLSSWSEHSHWVWSVRYNIFHDQLILTSSSDNRVTLYSIPSLSSEPFKEENLSSGGEETTVVLVEEDSLSANIKDSTKKTKNNTVKSKGSENRDRVVKVYEEHEDSVYAVEWSSVDPWIFGSISYDGRFCVNKVPKEEKFNILL